jgi:hypothetical protein
MYLIHCKKSPSLFPSQDVIVIVFLDGKMFPLWSLEFFRIFPFPAQNSHRILLSQLLAAKRAK